MLPSRLNGPLQTEASSAKRRSASQRECKQHTTSHAYYLSLPYPPDGHNQRLSKLTPLSHSTFCTTLPLAVGHSFTAEYTRRFTVDGAKQLFTFLDRAPSPPGSRVYQGWTQAPRDGLGQQYYLTDP
jgi:hypothetical protein